MGVYIKGMTKQQALQWLHYQMPFVFQVSDDDIIEVKEPHGRLIDANNIYTNKDGYLFFEENEAPTIIEEEDQR